MIGLVLIFLLMISVRLTASLDWGCWGIGSYTVLFTAMIFHQLLDFKKQLNRFTCPACREGSLCQKFCKSRVIYGFIAFGLSATMALSLLSFLVLSEKFYMLIIGMDIFVFHYLYTHWNLGLNSELVESANRVISEVAINFFNILLLIVMLISLELMYIKEVLMTPEIFTTINETVQHSCKVFQHLLRTKEFTESAIYAMRSIESVGEILFAFFYLSTLSLFPMTAITLLYKFGIRANHNLFGKKGGAS